MHDVLLGVALVGATITTGLTAGVFALYAHTIMPGLRKVDDRTFIRSFQAIDRAIINPWFMAGGFVGALVLTLAATVLSLREDPLPWLGVALVLYAFTFVATIAVNVPLNDALKAVDPDGDVDLAAVRREFGEARWAAWNLARTVASTGAFACLAWALVVFGGATG
ncbi:anthrone oxygenase family protein [Nocardioides sp. InS609-2]|uniref:anthrone oxygenase family protein n=1 Tax=Nocardioides sp. InS609-2 TaxID=2760705 RepID=UPI0020BFE9F0|nr:anthrone oxygenase family protein [Nocardioides sp. InS609-2]